MTVLGLLQQALYAALTGDEGLMARITGVYDYVPSGSVYPYIVIGDAEENTWDCLGRASMPSSEGYEVAASLLILTDNPGFKESIDVLVELERVLYAGVSVAGYTVILDSIRRNTKRDDTNGVRYIPVVVNYIVKKT